MSWRLTNQIKYLYQATLKKQCYAPVDPSDHDHCEFCWGKFGLEEGCLHFGYTTHERYRWICEQCFQDFRDQFEWMIDEETKAGN